MKLLKKCEVRFTVQDINSTHCSFVQEVRSLTERFPLRFTQVVYPELSNKVVLHLNLLASYQKKKKKVSFQGQQVVSNMQ